MKRRRFDPERLWLLLLIVLLLAFCFGMACMGSDLVAGSDAAPCFPEPWKWGTEDAAIERELATLTMRGPEQIRDYVLRRRSELRNVAMAESNQGVIGETDFREYPSVCQIQVGKAGGSGTLVDERVVLTAAHVVGNAQTASAFWPATGDRVEGRVFRVDHSHDLAVILIPRSPRCRPCRVAREEPRPGARITVAGFGGSPRKGFFAAVGHFLGIRSPREKAVSVPVSRGDSGGPLLSPEGEVVGVNSTSDLRSYVNGAGTVARINELVEVCGQASAGQTASGFG